MNKRRNLMPVQPFGKPHYTLHAKTDGKGGVEGYIKYEDGSTVGTTTLQDAVADIADVVADIVTLQERNPDMEAVQANDVVLARMVARYRAAEAVEEKRAREDANGIRHVTLNGLEVEVPDRISYAALCVGAGMMPEQQPAITYRKGVPSVISGSLNPGDDLDIINGMVINVARRDGA